jgi:hypothetical protein
VNWFDHCEVDTWSPLWIEDFVFELHYPKDPAMKIWWLLPGKDVGDGLRIIADDSDTLVMASLVHKIKNFVLYIDHDDSLSLLNWDDIVANPIASLPKVMSPHKVRHVESNKNAKLPDFYADLKKGADSEEYAEADDDNSSDDSDFVDSDYEVEDDDDDLFADNVDDEMKRVGKGRKAERRSNARDSNVDDELSSDNSDDDLQMPNSDGEGGLRLRFKPFRPEDINNPRFRVGIMFETVVQLRVAVTEYSIKERVDIKLLRNEKKRYEAVCVDGCSWYLYASVDSRAKGMVIKKYNGEHTCQRKWVLKRCTSRWLADKYIESFRADQKMTLTNFARTIQKDWNLTPSRSKIARARRLAMQKVLGDEAEQYKHLWDYGYELKRSNPGTTFYLKLNGNLFSTLYMSLDACKRGFLSACRPIICLDGCHIKTRYGGTILTAVGIDPNDCIYPIAIGIVEVECLLSWKWFLQTLKDDLGIDNTYPWTIMTDKQKVNTHVTLLQFVLIKNLLQFLLIKNFLQFVL